MEKRATEAGRATIESVLFALFQGQGGAEQKALAIEELHRRVTGAGTVCDKGELQELLDFLVSRRSVGKRWNTSRQAWEYHIRHLAAGYTRQKYASLTDAARGVQALLGWWIGSPRTSVPVQVDHWFRSVDNDSKARGDLEEQFGDREKFGKFWNIWSKAVQAADAAHQSLEEKYRSDMEVLEKERLRLHTDGNRIRSRCADVEDNHRILEAERNTLRHTNVQLEQQLQAEQTECTRLKNSCRQLKKKIDKLRATLRKTRARRAVQAAVVFLPLAAVAVATTLVVERYPGEKLAVHHWIPTKLDNGRPDLQQKHTTGRPAATKGAEKDSRKKLGTLEPLSCVSEKVYFTNDKPTPDAINVEAVTDLLIQKADYKLWLQTRLQTDLPKVSKVRMKDIRKRVDRHMRKFSSSAKEEIGSVAREVVLSRFLIRELDLPSFDQWKANLKKRVYTLDATLLDTIVVAALSTADRRVPYTFSNNWELTGVRASWAVGAVVKEIRRRHSRKDGKAIGIATLALGLSDSLAPELPEDSEKRKRCTLCRKKETRQAIVCLLKPLYAGVKAEVAKKGKDRTATK